MKNHWERVFHSFHSMDQQKFGPIEKSSHRLKRGKAFRGSRRRGEIDSNGTSDFASDLCRDSLSSLMSLQVVVRHCVLCGNIRGNDAHREMRERERDVVEYTREQNRGIRSVISYASDLQSHLFFSYSSPLWSLFLSLPLPPTHEY